MLRDFTTPFSWDSKLSDTFPSFHPPCIHQFEAEGVDEGLQYGVAFYHPRKNHLRRVLHQQEVGNVQSLTALFIGRDPFMWHACIWISAAAAIAAILPLP